jgi:hypothetical protein
LASVAAGESPAELGGTETGGVTELAELGGTGTGGATELNELGGAEVGGAAELDELGCAECESELQELGAAVGDAWLAWGIPVTGRTSMTASDKTSTPWVTSVE